MANPVCRIQPIREGHLINENRATPDAATQVEIYRRMAMLQAVFETAPAMKLTDAIDMESNRFTFLKPHEKKA